FDVQPEEPIQAAPEAPQINPITACLGAILASAAAAWMVAGIFSDFAAHFVALGGVVIGGGLVLLSYRFRWASHVQFGVIPVSLLAGAALVGPDSRSPGGLAGQVSEAIHAGGLLQPPISFDPGWRFILIVLFALVTAGTASLGVALARPKLGVALSLPLTLAGALIQPASSEMLSVVVALV